MQNTSKITVLAWFTISIADMSCCWSCACCCCCPDCCMSDVFCCCCIINCCCCTICCCCWFPMPSAVQLAPWVWWMWRDEEGEKPAHKVVKARKSWTTRNYFTNVLFGPSELQVYDGSVIRLQEISFGYSFSEKFLDKTPFGALSITASGFNLWYDAYNTPDRANFDPNVVGTGVGNGRGFDFLNGPSSKRYGLSIKASF